LKEVDVYIAPSQYIASRFKENFDVDASRVFVVHNGVDIERYRSIRLNRKRNVILFVGAWVPQKGVHILLNAVKLVKKEVPQVKVWIVGSSSLWPSWPGRESYERRLRSLANSFEHVSFFEAVTENELIKMYKKATICVIPSIYEEPASLVALEAQAAGLSIVASNVGGIPEMVSDGRTAILVPKNDVRALARAICKLLKDENLRMKMGMEGEKRAELFSWDKMVESILGIYERFLRW
jgi:glycosyltransferase involved in cell wall biosynthesis